MISEAPENVRLVISGQEYPCDVLRDPGRAREIRKDARLSQADIAEAVGANASQVNRWERGKVTPHRYFTLKLARLYGQLEEITEAG